MEDNVIIDLYWARDQRAIQASDAKYGPYCRAVAGSILWDHRDREECVSDTWQRAWNTMPPQKPSLLRAFFGAITRNLALNRYEYDHAQKRGGGQLPLALEELQDCLPAPNSTEQAVEAGELTALLETFLRSLPTRERTVFLRRYWYLQPVKDIARSLGLGESRVKMTLLRTRAKLREVLEKEGIAL